jgi:hypothetical protein
MGLRTIFATSEIKMALMKLCAWSHCHSERSGNLIVSGKMTLGHAQGDKKDFD